MRACLGEMLTNGLHKVHTFNDGHCRVLLWIGLLPFSKGSHSGRLQWWTTQISEPEAIHHVRGRVLQLSVDVICKCEAYDSATGQVDDCCDC